MRHSWDFSTANSQSGRAFTMRNDDLNLHVDHYCGMATDAAWSGQMPTVAAYGATLRHLVR